MEIRIWGYHTELTASCPQVKPQDSGQHKGQETCDLRTVPGSSLISGGIHKRRSLELMTTIGLQSKPGSCPRSACATLSLNEPGCALHASPHSVQLVSKLPVGGRGICLGKASTPGGNLMRRNKAHITPLVRCRAVRRGFVGCFQEAT